MELFERLRGLRLLLVEDDQWIRDSLRRFFAGEQCSLMAVENGEDGLELVRHHGCDIIITDYRLPGMNGIEFLREVQPISPRVGKVLITAFMTEPVIAEAFRVGVHEFIEKPFSMEDLEDSLTRLLDKNSFLAAS
ncbi:MAG: response regulator [Thermodesulfobacteriota bacterium]